jgi:GTPase
MIEFRAGFVALIGEPNVGKSTLTNVLVGDHVTIVSAKPQTTRRRANGIISGDGFQFMLWDAPGWVESKTGLNPFLLSEVKDCLKNADVVVLCLGPGSRLDVTENLWRVAQSPDKKVVTVLLQSDIEGWAEQSESVKYLKSHGQEPIAISAVERSNDAMIELIPKFASLLPKSQGPLYETDMYTTQTMRELTSEVVREQCFVQLEQEVPYGLALKIREFNEGLQTRNGDALIRVAADIVVERETHRPIVVGQKGQRIKSIGQAARLKLEQIFGLRVHLELHVKVRENWMQTPEILKEMGYVVQSK